LARHITVNRCTTLALDNIAPEESSVALTTSLLVGLTSYGNKGAIQNPFSIPF
jgi:hypothetical protein